MTCNENADASPSPGEPEIIRSASQPLRPALWATVGALCVVMACASAGGGLVGAFDRHWEAGEYADAVRQFRADSTLRERERPLYRMALLYASPRDTFFDSSTADSLFGRLLELYPETRYRGTARAFQGILKRMRSSQARADSLLAKIEALKEISTGQAGDTTGEGS